MIERDIQAFLDRIKLAGQALKHLPKDKLPRGNAAWWPQTVRDAKEAYGYQDTPVNRRTPTYDELTALEWLIDAVWELDPQYRAIVMARAQGTSWRKISRQAKQLGHWPNSHESCRRMYRVAVNELASVKA